MPSTFNRIKERKLAQWALAYLAGAWLILEVTDVVGGRFGLPDTLYRGLFILIVFGFFAALVLAWYHGEKGRQRVGGLELLLLTGLFGLAGVAVTVVGRAEFDGDVAAVGDGLELEFSPEVVARRIAVLPFDNLSPDREADEYLVDGIHDEILTRLSQIDAFDVISRASVMRFRGPAAPDSRTIGDSLQAGLILAGTVRRAGSSFRLAVQLTDARTDRNLWADTYDHELTAAALFDLQSDVALRVAQAVQAEVSPAVQRRLENRGTENDQAYDEYLSGTYHQRRFELEDAERFFQKAVTLDPRFAAAHAELAVTYILLGNLNRRPPAVTLPLARASAERAQLLDVDLPQTQMALVSVNWSAERNWPEVGRLLERAMAQSPSSSRAHDWYSQYLSLMRRDDRAVEHVRTAWELDPLDPLVRYKVGRALYWSRRCDRAVEHLTRTLEAHPELHAAHVFLALCDSEEGRHDEAVARIRRALPFSANDLTSRLTIARIQALAGRETEARAILAEAEQRRVSEHVSAGFIALVYVGLGEHDRAFEWLETARAEFDSWLFQLHAPSWDPIRDDPRFLDFLATLNLPPEVAAPPRAWVFPEG